MKDMNFNTLRDLPVPESWIENALAIPEKEEQKAVVPFWRSNRFIAAAASIVLAGALSAALFLSFGGHTDVPVKPSSTEIVWSTDESGETVATEIVVVPDGEPDGDMSPTEDEPGIISSFRRVLSGDSASPTSPVSPTDSPTSKTSPTSGGGISPATKPDTTESPEPSSHPSQAPTHRPQEPTAAPKPTQAPIQAPTQPPTQTPAPITLPTSSPWFHEDPTEPSIDNTEPETARYVTAMIPWSSVPKDRKVYCILETSDGEELGDYGFYDDERLMNNLGSGDSAYIYNYEYTAHIKIPSEMIGETVNYYIYDREGNILKTGTIRL